MLVDKNDMLVLFLDLSGNSTQLKARKITHYEIVPDVNFLQMKVFVVSVKLYLWFRSHGFFAVPLYEFYQNVIMKRLNCEWNDFIY